MKFDLKYGRDVVSFEPPRAWTVSLIDHKRPFVRPFEETLVASTAAPYGSPPLEDWVVGKDVLVIVSDVTRYTGADLLLPLLQRKFLHRARRARILFALGNHRKHTEAEQRALVSDAVYETIPCIDHDCFNERVLVSAGRHPLRLEGGAQHDVA